LLSAGALVGVIQTPGLSHFFGCRPLGPLGWGTAVVASIAATSFASAADRVLQRDVLTPLRLAERWIATAHDVTAWAGAAYDGARPSGGSAEPRVGVEVVDGVFVDGPLD
jgi:hypothetical protein